MKAKLILLAGLFYGLVASAQTNTIIFAQLLSPTNSVLMTNAEFRCYSGAKIFFKNNAGYESFQANDLNTNVLNVLGTSPAKLKTQQQALDQNNVKWNKISASQLAAIQIQKQQATDQKQSAQQAHIDYLRAMSSMGRTGWDGQHYNDNQSIGNFIGN